MKMIVLLGALLLGMQNQSLHNPMGDTLTIDEAKTKFEKKYNVNVMLPSFVPLKPTHIGGSFSEGKGQLRVRYYNEENHEYLIVDVVRNQQNKLTLLPNGDQIKLNDGNEAIYYHDPKEVADRLHFLKNGLEYRIGISKHNRKVTLSELQKVARSLR